jgi:hypothetical protein
MGRDLFLCRQQKRKLDLELDPFLTPRPGDLIQKKLLLLLPWVPKGCRIIRVKGLDLLFLPSQTSKEARSLTLKRKSEEGSEWTSASGVKGLSGERPERSG